jgi:hypothetical protein
MLRFLPALAVLFLLSQTGCRCSASAEASGGPATVSYAHVLIEDVPHVRQKPDFCGEACAEMALRKLGYDIDQDQVFDRSGLDPLSARGAYAPDLKHALTDIGFDVGDVWHKFDPEKADEGLEAQFAALHADLADGHPSIVCMHVGKTDGPEHFRLVVGYDPESDEVVYHEPGMDEGAYQRIDRAEFLELWPLRYDEDEWTVIRLRLEPGTIRAQEPAQGFTAADYAQHLIALRPMIPDGFTVLIEPPFVVLGDEDPDTVRSRAEHTVRWSVRLLEKDYFPKSPDTIIDIWLFGDETSYLHHAKTLFGDEPDTPYGYYSPPANALIMNIATGGGTLVHEIVHPYVASNFPDAPPWLNEGMGSLYEACGERDGQIRGLTNWRLPGLQRAISEDMVPTFRQLTDLGEGPFYDDNSGIYYAQSRYLCYYLEQKGLLRKLYHEFLANREADPTGYKTLEKVLGDPHMGEFQDEWEAYVMELSYPPKVEIEAG